MSGRHRSERARARQQVSLGAILSLDHAAYLMPMSDGEARSWLRREGLVRLVAGREVIRWRDVWERVGPLGSTDEWAEAPAPVAVLEREVLL